MSGSPLISPAIGYPEKIRHALRLYRCATARVEASVKKKRIGLLEQSISSTAMGHSLSLSRVVAST